MINNKEKVEMLEFTEITPFLEDNNIVEISNSLINKRFKVNKGQLLKLISELDKKIDSYRVKNLEDIGLIGDLSVTSIKNKSKIEHWYYRNWTQSLNYYMWSRNATFADVGENYDSIRETILRDFVETDDYVQLSPKEIQTEGIELCSPEMNFNCTLGEVMKKRSSVQSFKTRTIGDQLFSNVLYHSFEQLRNERITLNPEENILDFLRGLGYAFDIYLAIFDIENIDSGIYFYDIKSHKIELLKNGIYRDEVQKALIGQKAIQTANVTIFLVTNYSRKQWRYRHERELRNVYIYAGQIAHKLIMTATASNLFCNITPASQDSYFENLLELDNTSDQVVYSVCLGNG